MADKEPNFAVKYTENQTLVGYVRKSNHGGKIKISINIDAFDTCEKYTTSDGQSYVALSMSIENLKKVLSGERAVTTVVQSKDN
jgi:hypothetical protein